jgi:hypothetical protein
MRVMIDGMVEEPKPQLGCQGRSGLVRLGECLQGAFQFYEGTRMLGAVIVYGGFAYEPLLHPIAREQVGAFDEVTHDGIFVAKMLHGCKMEGVQEAE